MRVKSKFKKILEKKGYSLRTSHIYSMWAQKFIDSLGELGDRKPTEEDVEKFLRTVDSTSPSYMTQGKRALLAFLHIYYDQNAAWKLKTSWAPRKPKASRKPKVKQRRESRTKPKLVQLSLWSESDQDGRRVQQKFSTQVAADLERFSKAIAGKYSTRTQETYVRWVKRFLGRVYSEPNFVGPPTQDDGVAFANSIKDKVAANYLVQGTAAIGIFLAEIHKSPTEKLLGTDKLFKHTPRRKTKRRRVPKLIDIPQAIDEAASVTTKPEFKQDHWPQAAAPHAIRKIFSHLGGRSLLIAQLMYGAGLRHHEALFLRICDIDFDNMHINIRGAKGVIHRKTILPRRLEAQLKAQIEMARIFHSEDLSIGCGLTDLPGVEDKTEFKWQYLFPGLVRFNGKRGSQHESIFNKALREACSRAGIPGLAPDKLRKAFGRSLVLQGVDILTIHNLLGNQDLKSTMTQVGWTQANSQANSPIDIE
jgi:integrase